MAAIASGADDDAVVQLLQTIEKDLDGDAAYGLGKLKEMPSGWLSKRGEAKGLLSSTSFKKRFVVLEDRQLLKYFADDGGKKPCKGAVDLALVTSVRAQREGAKFIITLITAKRSWIFAAEDQKEAQRWTALLHHCSSNCTEASAKEDPAGGGSQNTAQAIMASKMKSLTKMISRNAAPGVKPPCANPEVYFKETFEAGPLGLRLEANDADEVVIRAFLSGKDGAKGASELRGTIQVGDILVAVNDIPLRDNALMFCDAVDIVVEAAWPKTFLIERPAKEPEPDFSGWLNKLGENGTFRRRFFKLFGDLLFYYKPSLVEGSLPTSTPVGHIALASVDRVNLRCDESRPQKERYCMELSTAERKWVLSAQSADDAQSWCDTLSKLGKQVIQEKSSSFGEADAHLAPWAEERLLHTGHVRRRCAFAEKFHPRICLLSEAGLLFKRGSKDGFGQTIGLSTVSKISIRNLESATDWPYCLVLACKTGDKHILAVESDGDRDAWLEKLQSAVKMSSLSGKVTFEGNLAKASGSGGQDEQENENEGDGDGDGFDEDATDVDALWKDMQTQAVSERSESETGNSVIEHQKPHGFMWKRGDVDRFSNLIGKDSGAAASAISQYKKRWFELDHHELRYFKTKEGSAAGGVATGCIDMHRAMKICPSVVDGAPSNSIDIVTQTRTYTLAVATDEEHAFWVSCLGNAADIYGAEAKEAILADEEAKKAEEQERLQRKEAMLKSIVKAGFLQKKGRVNTAYKQRYFCLSKDATLAYYATEDDATSDDGEAIGAIAARSINEMCCPASEITQVNTFKIVTLTRELVVAAASKAEAKSWMDAICTAAGSLSLKEDGEGFITENVNSSISNTLGYYGAKGSALGASKGGKRGKKKRLGGGRKKSVVAK
eukprot:g4228.t1